MRLFAVAFLLACLGTPASAQEPEPSPSIPALSTKRLGYLVESGIASHDPAHAELSGGQYNFLMRGGFFYSAGPKFTVGVAEGWHFGRDLGEFEGGLRWNITGGKSEDTMRAALGVNGVVYHGEGAEMFVEDLSWNAGLYGSMRLFSDTYLKIQGVHDMENSHTEFRGMIGISDLFD
jgi:hypothetical protein